MVEGTSTGLCVVCDFPFGLSTTASKVKQVEEYCSHYHIEDLDIVSNYGRLRSGDLDYVTRDIQAVVEVCHKYGTNVKVIIETDSLTLDQVRQGTRCAVAAGADFIKSSTGFYTGGPQNGATNEVVAAMMEAGEGRIKVKGSGAIRTQAHFFELIDMRFSPGALAGKENLQKFVWFLRACQQMGIYHNQFNVIDSATLRDAKVHPENYPDLIVRVAGYCAQFISLMPEAQDAIIARTENACRRTRSRSPLFR